MSLQFKDTKQIRTGIETDERHAAAEAMGKVLGTSYVLYLKTQYYHWNVVGNSFFALHNLFEAQYMELADAIDELAERIRALGLTTPGTFKEFTQLSGIEEDTSLPAEGMEMVKNLIEGHETVTRECRDVINKAKLVEDEVTIDILTQRMAVHEKAAWMLRSTLGQYAVVVNDNT
jgi:starvation-inducible DNA-binding protein